MEENEEDEGKWVDEFYQHLQKRLKILGFSEYDIFDGNFTCTFQRRGEKGQLQLEISRRYMSEDFIGGFYGK